MTAPKTSTTIAFSPTVWGLPRRSVVTSIGYQARGFARARVDGVDGADGVGSVASDRSVGGIGVYANSSLQPASSASSRMHAFSARVDIVNAARGRRSTQRA